MIFPPAWPSPSQRFTHFFLAAAPCLPCNSCVLRLLRTLFLSLRSFRRSPRLFSIACGLFLQNTGGGVPLRHLRALRASALSFAVILWPVLFHPLTNPSSPRIDLQHSLFSCTCKSLFPQLLCIRIYTKRPGVTHLTTFPPTVSTLFSGNFPFPQSRVIVLASKGDLLNVSEQSDDPTRIGVPTERSDEGSHSTQTDPRRGNTCPLTKSFSSAAWAAIPRRATPEAARPSLISQSPPTKPTKIKMASAKSAPSGTKLSSGASKPKSPSNISKRVRSSSSKDAFSPASGKTKKARSAPALKSSPAISAC